MPRDEKSAEFVDGWLCDVRTVGRNAEQITLLSQKFPANRKGDAMIRSRMRKLGGSLLPIGGRGLYHAPMDCRVMMVWFPCEFVSTLD